MKAYTITSFRQHLAEALSIATIEGAIKVFNRNGDEFLVQPTKKNHSAFDDAKCLNLPNISTDDIVAAIRESRRR